MGNFGNLLHMYVHTFELKQRKTISEIQYLNWTGTQKVHDQKILKTQTQH